MVWLQFVLCAGLIGFPGVRLSRYGDAIAALTGLSRNWVGLILLATVTSLPELVTGLSAVTVAAAPDIAVGDVLGSCVFNLMILALIDILHRPGSLYKARRSAQAMWFQPDSASFCWRLRGWRCCLARRARCQP